MQATSEIRQASLDLLHLRLGLVADDRLEVAHQHRIGMRARHRADAIERVVHVGDPVAQRLVHGVLQRARARLHRDHRCAQHLHADHVGLLPLDVDGAHIDHAFEPEARAQRRGGDAVLAGAGLGDDALLAHAPRQHDLAEHVVHLVRAGVVELLALEVDLGAAEMLGEALGEIERRGPADIVLEIAVHLGLEGRIGLGRRCRPSPDRGSAASGFRRRSGRRKCRNARARRDRCGRNLVWRCSSDAQLLTCILGGARGANEGLDHLGILDAGGALDTGGHVDAAGAR